MKYFSISLIYLGFFSLVGLALYITQNPHTLWSLILLPTINIKTDKTEEE
jgi:hypothetical protein